MKISGTFIIRVYGIIINENREILISDEFQQGMKMTKFPGGGLEFGEGPIDTLKREFREECNGQKLKNIDHFYTTDFFQKAWFYENHQLISIYYQAELNAPVQFKISEKPFDFGKMENGKQSFRWIHINHIKPEIFTLPIDKLIADKLISKDTI